MAVIIPPGYAQATLTFNAVNTFRGSTSLVLGFGGELGDDPTSLSDFAIIVALAWEEYMAPQMDSQVILTNTRVVGPTTAAEYASSIPGTGSFDDVPPQVATLISHTTARRGRRGRGRSFLYGFLSDTTTQPNGTMTEARRVQIQNAWDAFVVNCSDPVVPGVEFVILQGDEGTTPAIDPPPVVTSSNVQARTATQRRRVRR